MTLQCPCGAAAACTTPLGKVSQGLSHCQPHSWHPNQLQPCLVETQENTGKSPWDGCCYPPPSPQQPQPHPIDVNAFLLNSYKTEYKILESTIVIKENFNSAVSGHLVHPVKCLVLWFRLFFFPCFLGFLFFLWFFLRVSLPLFQFQVAASPRAEAAVVQTNSALTRLLSTRLWQSSSIVK